CLGPLKQCKTLVPCGHNLCGSCFTEAQAHGGACPECGDEALDHVENEALDQLASKSGFLNCEALDQLASKYGFQKSAHTKPQTCEALDQLASKFAFQKTALDALETALDALGNIPALAQYTCSKNLKDLQDQQHAHHGNATCTAGSGYSIFAPPGGTAHAFPAGTDEAAGAAGTAGSGCSIFAPAPPEGTEGVFPLPPEDEGGTDEAAAPEGTDEAASVGGGGSAADGGNRPAGLGRGG
ncbi:hypothetical protein T484DRAFT_1862044, partial [Baffinella frigidus]